MKKPKSKFFIALTAFSISLSILAINPIQLLAAGTGDDPTVTLDVKTEKQVQAEKVKDKQLAEYKGKRAAEREQFVKTKKAIATIGAANITAASGQKEIAVPSFQQQTSYWCGPATVKQILHFINGSSETQQHYATDLGTTTAGTDFSLVDNILNNHESAITYLYYQVPNLTEFQSKIDYDIDTDFPAALDLKITPQNMPKYTTTVEGHILNTSGYDYIYATEDELRLTDPYDQGGRGVTLGNVWHPYLGVYNANQLHFRKAIIW